MSLSKQIHDDDSRWSEIMDWPLVTAAVVFLVAYSIPILNPDVSAQTAWWCEAIQWTTWVLFAMDYLVRLRVADDRGRWFVRHLHELAIIILPMFRQLRILRVVTVLTVVNRHATVGLRGRVMSYLTCGAALLSYVTALAVLDAERDAPDATITNFGDSWWWALTTMTTVGYGDRYPVTTEGRLIAAGLMICGIGLLGTVTAMLASWFSDRVSRQGAAANAAILDEIRSLREEIADLKSDSSDVPNDNEARAGPPRTDA